MVNIILTLEPTIQSAKHPCISSRLTTHAFLGCLLWAAVLALCVACQGMGRYVALATGSRRIGGHRHSGTASPQSTVVQVCQSFEQ